MYATRLLNQEEDYVYPYKHVIPDYEYDKTKWKKIAIWPLIIRCCILHDCTYRKTVPVQLWPGFNFKLSGYSMLDERHCPLWYQLRICKCFWKETSFSTNCTISDAVSLFCDLTGYDFLAYRGPHKPEDLIQEFARSRGCCITNNRGQSYCLALTYEEELSKWLTETHCKLCGRCPITATEKNTWNDPFCSPECYDLWWANWYKEEHNKLETLECLKLNAKALRVVKRYLKSPTLQNLDAVKLLQEELKLVATSQNL